MYIIVGYGDYYPRTIAGRGVIFFTCIWGIFVVSMMVVTLTTALNLSSAERKVKLHFEYTFKSLNQ